MANKTVADLTSKIPALTDIIPVADPTTGVAGKSLVSDVVNFGLPTQSGNSGKYLTTNGTSAYWDSNPLGTVTSVGGNGTVNGLSLSGTVTSSGNITLGGTLSGVDLTTAVSGILPVTNGGTGTSNGSITGTGELVFTSPASSNVKLITQDHVPNPSVDTEGGTIEISPGTGYDYVGANGPFQYRKLTGTVKINGIDFKTAPSDGWINQSNLTFPSEHRSILIGNNSATALGNFAQGDTAGNAFVGVGYGVFQNATSLTGSLAVGDQACGNGTSYYFSTGIGNGSLKENGYYDAGIGGAALYSKTTGQSNTGVGFRSLGYGTSFDQTTAIGMDSGAYATSNTAVLLDKATNCVFVGWRSRPLANDANNEIVIGSNAVGEGSNTATLGNLNVITTKLHGYTKTKSVQETVYTITDGSSVDINPANGGIQVWTLGANRTPTASSFAEGQSVTLMVDDGTAYAITWTSISPTWVGGSAPTLATTGYTVIELWKRSSTIYGALVGTV